MNNKIVGIIGAALLLLGIFLPVISFFSYFDLIRISPGEMWTGIIILLLAIVSLILAATNKVKILIATGLCALGLLVLDFFRFRSAGADSGNFSWGFYVMVIAAIVLIVAGVMKGPGPAMGGGYGAPPPPPYPPAR